MAKVTTTDITSSIGGLLFSLIATLILIAVGSFALLIVFVPAAYAITKILWLWRRPEQANIGSSAFVACWSRMTSLLLAVTFFAACLWALAYDGNERAWADYNNAMRYYQTTRQEEEQQRHQQQVEEANRKKSHHQIAIPDKVPEGDPPLGEPMEGLSSDPDAPYHTNP